MPALQGARARPRKTQQVAAPKIQARGQEGVASFQRRRWRRPSREGRAVFFQGCAATWAVRPAGRQVIAMWSATFAGCAAADGQVARRAS